MEMITKGKIRPSKSLEGLAIVIVAKANGRLYLCMDYRGLNKVTMKNRYPVPLLSELRDRLNRASILNKLDHKDRYYLICDKEGDEWKTAFALVMGCMYSD